MRIFLLIIGVVFAALGLGLTGYSWYAASTSHQIVNGAAYSGPFFIIVGAWRIIAAGMTGATSALRIIAVVIGFGAGYANGQALKAAFPNDTVIEAESKTTTTTPNN
jgi:hypothetical protein